MGCRRPEWCLRRGSQRALRKHPGTENAPRGPDTLARATRPEPENQVVRGVLWRGEGRPYIG